MTDDPYSNEPEYQAALEKLHPCVTDHVLERTRAWHSSSTDEEKPERIGVYQLTAKLGEGGMGAVYKAIHTKLGKQVAIKVLPSRRMRDRNALARFEREMKAVGGLEHPNIVRASDAGEADGIHFLVMEYVEGADLAKLGRHVGPLPIPEACELIRQAALGLQHAHEHGLVHRDIKPSNLMLTTTGQVKILDLGLALLPHDFPENEEPLTSTGYTLGTLDYMAPEQASDCHGVDIRTDIYSLGASLYCLLTGHPPFSHTKDRSPVQRITALVTEPVPSIQGEREGVPDTLADVVHRMLVKNPDDRYCTPAEVVAALEPFSRSHDCGLLLASIGPPISAKSDKASASTSNYRSSSLASTAPLPPSPIAPPVVVPVVASPPTPAVQARRRYWTPRMTATAVLPFALMLLGVVIWLNKTKIVVPDGSEVEVSSDGSARITTPDTQTEPESTSPTQLIAPFSAAEAQQYQEQWAKHLGVPVAQKNSIGMKLTLIPPGVFTMGAPASERHRQDDEAPPHQVRITKPFYMGAHEVTQGECKRIMGAHPSLFSGRDDRLPAVNLTWDESLEFCAKLSTLATERQAGRSYRLPTEAEWEYACRAGTTGPFHYGDSITSHQANFRGDAPYGTSKKGPTVGRSMPVGNYEPNAFGLYDMHGNVWERCADWYGPYTNEELSDPQGPLKGSSRLIRGGGWLDHGTFCRSAERGDDPAPKGAGIGLRVVCSIGSGQLLPPTPTASTEQTGPEKQERRPQSTGTGHRVDKASPLFSNPPAVAPPATSTIPGKNTRSEVSFGPSEAYLINHSVTMLTKTAPKINIEKHGIPMTAEQRDLVAKPDGRYLKQDSPYGYQVFCFPNRGPMQLSWTGYADGNGQISVCIWDGTKWKPSMEAYRSLLKVFEPKTYTEAVYRPPDEERIFVFVNCTSGKVFTDAILGTIRNDN